MIAEVTFSIGEVAAMVGMSAHTIRAWERRYGVLSPERTRGNQRRYTVEDVEHLVHVKRAVSARGLSLKLAVMEQEGDLPHSVEPPAQSAVVEHDRQLGPWRKVADLLHELLLIINVEGIVVDANITVARALGIVREKLSGVRFIDLVEPYDRAKAVKLYRKPEKRRGWELNMKAPHLNGLHSFDCWPLRASRGPLVVLIGTDLARAAGEHWGS
jgi:DNA-binding transcriptional MerR regulator